MFKIFDNPSGTVIQPESDIMSDAAEKLRLLLTDLIKKGARKLSFDFSAVKDMDAAALFVFFLLPDTLMSKFPDAELEIIHASEDIVNMFKMTKISKRYKMSESQFAALTELRD